MGIDQLGFQSVQPGYLKILQMGNADPNITKAGKEYEILLRHGSFNCSNCFLTGHGTHNRRNCPGAKSVKASQYSAQILASTTYCLRPRAQIWFYLSQQLLTTRTKLKTARNTYPEAHRHRRTLYSTVAKTHQLTTSSHSLSNVEPGFLTGINRKSYSRRAQRHQSRSKQRRKSTAIYRRRV
ncbi:zinc finger protein 93 [Dorcoceras hygrometricum]|uniref:Zinc finger protein 93 n=1 Tax=Dorcoceras hygrometricum TaxID=472368 RepID=A0A2Z7ANA4_9LAMI|nr:zinc finger protein 93 [Dorcoceras hygrometricum]